MNKHIFITGATGNVGGKLGPHILRHLPESSVTLLVRGLSKSHARDRALRTLKTLTPDFDSVEAERRISVICGDISKPKLGLADRDYAALAERTTHIIHAAAATKFRLPEDEARMTNYEGARHMVDFGRLARDLGGLHKFAHISTAYACGDQSGDIAENPYDSQKEFSNIYEQTKWEAERYLYTCRDSLPVTIFRPSIIVGDSRTGAINDFNVLYAPLRLILTGRVRILPCRPDIPLDIVPVDYVADSITRIVFRSDETCGGIYHIVAGTGRETSVSAIVDSAIRCFERRYPAYPVDRVRYLPVAGARLARFISTGSRAMSIMREYLPYFTTVRHFDDTNTRSSLPDSVRAPRFETYVDNLMRYFIETDLGKRIRSAA